MRDVVTGFYSKTLRTLIRSNKISTSDKVLVVCGGPLDESVLRSVGFADFTVTGLDDAALRQDAENLTYDDASFDVVLVHAGLHHCFSPHRALLEMYRVARKAVLAFESRDSYLMNVALRFGLTEQYELSSVTADGRGGAADSGVPNFVYRWTERDVINTIACFDPAREPRVMFFYDMRLPVYRLTISGRRILRLAAILIEPLSRLFAAIAPKQCNEFAFAIFKDGECHPWITPAQLATLRPHDAPSTAWSRSG